MKKTLYIYAVLWGIVTAGISSCSMSKDDTGSEVNSGQAGSLARFTVVGNYLYTVDPYKLHTISLADKEHPQKVSATDLGFYTETIFPYNDALLLGTDNGMFVFNITNPAQPAQKTFFQHVRSCDPVVAQNGYAYLTLNTANQRCFNGQNQLQIIDISNLSNPYLVKSMDMGAPKGLDINNDTLLVCDKGIVAYDVSNKQSPVELFHEWGIGDNVIFNDVIWYNSTILAIASNGLHQYKFVSGGLQKISSIEVTQ